METEVCSLYLFEPTQQRLILRATVGLDRDSVGKVSMRTSEGLVGMVIETMQPVAVADAISHPRYKYFPETGEERYHSFLGVPVTEQLITSRSGCWSPRPCASANLPPTRSACCAPPANQLAQMLNHFRLRQTLATKEKERDEYRRRMIEANRQLKDYEKVGGKTRLAAPVKIRRPRLVGLAAAPDSAMGSRTWSAPSSTLSI